ncbi:MAG: hypothetical protein SNF33_00915 [Candidatus Algichlamydia australiensis]|nr:hypothetical protein [Chlamydiales bacterium]
MRIFVFCLFFLVSVFATEVKNFESYKSEYITIKKELSSLCGEAELLEKRYKEYAQEFASELEAAEVKFTQIQEEMVRLRKSPALGFEGRRNENQYIENKKAIVTVRKQLIYLQNKGKKKLESYKTALQETQKRMQYLEKRQAEIKTHLYESVDLAQKEMIASKKALLSALKSRKTGLETYQEAYQNALQNYRSIKEKIDSYL